MKIQLTDIIIEHRVRKEFGDLFALAESIRKFGLISPILVKPEGDRYRLIAGERRCRASILAGFKSIEAHTKDDCSELERRQIELEENLMRQNLLWSEEVEAKFLLDELMRELHGSGSGGKFAKEGWKLENTAEMLDQSIGQTSADLKLARALHEDKELAVELLKYPKTIAAKKLSQIQERKRLDASNIRVTAVDYRLGDCCSLIDTLDSNSIDLWITDPPFGVAQIMDAKGNFPDMATGTDNFTEEGMRELYHKLLPKVFRVLKPSAHFYMFFGNEFYPFLMKVLEHVGFHVDPCPIIWYKARTTTPFRGLSFMQCYEPILFGCKPPREKYLSYSTSNFFQVSPVKDKAHVFHKPHELLKEFIQLSSNPGDYVLDTFAGSGSTLVTAHSLKRCAIGFEFDENNYNAGCEFINKETEDVLGNDK
jgi:DNA modification methylase